MPNFQHSLVSVGKTCDDNHVVVFDKNKVNVFKNMDHTMKQTTPPITQGERDPTTSSWTIPLGPTSQANYAHKLTSTKKLVQCYHQTLGSPTVTTLKTAVANNHFATWPRLTIDAINKHLPPSTATAKGHLMLHHKNWHTTKPRPEESCIAPFHSKQKRHMQFTNAE